MNRWLAILLIAVWIVIRGVSHAADHESSISGAVYRGNDPDAGLTDLWLATLSKQPALKVLERTEIHAVLGELSLKGVSDDVVRQVRLGRLLGVDYFTWIKASDEQAQMEVVEAATGRGIAVIPAHFAKGHFPEILPKLAEQAFQAISRPLPGPSQVAPSLAFSIPRLSTSNDAVRASVETVVADLSGALASSGITLLSRRFAAVAVQERWRQEKGLVEDTAQERAFLGADYLLGIVVDATNQIEFTLVETATGRRVGRREIPMGEARTVDGLKAMKQWGLDRLKPFPESPSVLPPAAVTNGHYAAPEVLKSLYAGIVLHNQGRYIDALPWFEDAKARKIKIDETEAWVANCFRLSGFPEIADELAEDNAWASYRQGGPSLNAQSEPGIALLGVTAGPGIPHGSAERMGMLLIDGLYKASGVKVLASEDMAGLRDEYDVLLGLEKVKGTTWRQAPPILVREAVTGHLEPDKAGLRLRLCLIRNCNPTSIVDVVTSLPSDRARWQPLIEEAAKALLLRGSLGSPPWSPPSLHIEEDQQQLLSQLEQKPTPWIYLKALTRNSDLLKYRTKNPWRLGLARWFLRVLPEGHPERPMLGFTVASIHFNRYQAPAVLQRVRSDFQKIADRYPLQLGGLLSRYNMALIDMTTTNYAATESSIARLLPELTRFDHGEAHDMIGSIRKMDSILRYALGLPDGQPADVSRYGGFASPSSYGITMLYSTLPRGTRFQPHNTSQMGVDLQAYVLRRDQDVVSARFLRDIIEQNGPDAALTHYAVVKYFDAMMVYYQFMGRSWPEEDLCVVCPVFADCLRQLIQNEPDAKSSLKSGIWLHLDNRLPKNPIITTAMQKARQTLEMIDAGPDEQRRKVFEESWKVGPLRDPAWLEYCEEKGFQVGVKEYYPYLNRLHELYDGEVKSQGICRLYCQFGLVFFRGGRYDLAEPLFEQIVSWRDYKNRPPEKQVHALSLYLLAVLKQRNGDTPSALRLAKEAADYMDQHPESAFNLISSLQVSGSWGGGGGLNNLKARATTFIKQLREDPGMAFKNPYQ